MGRAACVGSLWAKPVASASPGGTRWTHRPEEGEAGELQMGGFPLLVSVWVLCPCSGVTPGCPLLPEPVGVAVPCLTPGLRPDRTPHYVRMVRAATSKGLKGRRAPSPARPTGSSESCEGISQKVPLDPKGCGPPLATPSAWLRQDRDQSSEFIGTEPGGMEYVPQRPRTSQERVPCRSCVSATGQAGRWPDAHVHCCGW